MHVFRYIHKHIPYVDKKRTALWGWSYGGYNALMTLAKDRENIFKCGVAVSPLVDFLYYGKNMKNF